MVRTITWDAYAWLAIIITGRKAIMASVLSVVFIASSIFGEKANICAIKFSDCLSPRLRILDALPVADCRQILSP